MAAAVAIVLFLFGSAPLWSQARLIESGRIDVPEGTTRFERGPGGRVYALSHDKNVVGVQRRPGTAFVIAGGMGWSLNALDGPAGLCVDGLTVLIADRNNHRIVRYDLDLRPISAFSTVDTSYAPARFGYPVGVAVNHRGDVGILDGENKEFVVFDPSGRVQFRFGRDARSNRKLSFPVDVTVDEDGDWLVLDRSFLAWVDPFGTLLTSEDIPSGEATAVSAHGPLTVVATTGGILAYTGRRLRSSIPFSAVVQQEPAGRVRDVLAGESMIELLMNDVVAQFMLEEFER